MPCWAMMPPIRKVMSRMMGTACQATRSNWLTVEVNLNSRGRHEHASRGDADRAEHVGEQHQIAAEPGAGLGRRRRARRRFCSRCGRTRGLAIDAMHLLEQAAVVLGQPDDHRLASGRRPGAGQALQQPGAERVELADARHVDRYALRLARPRRPRDRPASPIRSHARRSTSRRRPARAARPSIYWSAKFRP